MTQRRSSRNANRGSAIEAAATGTLVPDETHGASMEWPSKAVIDRCRMCPLWERATQGVAGEGPRNARLLLVGEQPGDEEDIAGRPFVGPAGRLLRQLLEEAGIDASKVYITNAVKHFSWELRGKRRLHKTPAQREIAACRTWLEREIALIAPRAVVALGASALAALFGERMKVGAARDQVLEMSDGTRVFASFHPSAVLRAPDEPGKRALRAALQDDLIAAARFAAIL